MQVAQQRDASAKAQFHFRKNVFPVDRPRERYDLASRSITPPPPSMSPRVTSPVISPVLANGHAFPKINGSNGASSNGTSRKHSLDMTRVGEEAGPSSRTSRLNSFDQNNANGSNGQPSTPRQNRSTAPSSRCPSPEEVEGGEDDTAQMTIDEIINGRGEDFPGLMGVVNAYLNSLNVDVCTKCELRRYLDLIKWRAKGERRSSPIFLAS